MAQVTWLGIDLGLSKLGWAAIAGEETETPYLITCGTIETDKALSTPERLVEIEADLMELVKEFDPDGVAVEMPFFDRLSQSGGESDAGFGNYQPCGISGASNSPSHAAPSQLEMPFREWESN
jgi:crossover junction endodeoxyribonuclease RuvC